MKILSNLIISGGWLRPNGDAAQVGDSVRLYLDDGTEIVGTIEFPIAEVNCGQDRAYRVAYDREEIIRAADVIDGVVLDSTDSSIAIVANNLQNEISNRIADVNAEASERTAAIEIEKNERILGDLNEQTARVESISNLDQTIQLLDNDFVNLGDRVDSLEIGQSVDRIAYQTLALLDADLDRPVNTLAEVTNDSTPSNNGTYIKVGASGTGSWLKSTNDLSGRVTNTENQIEEIELKTQPLSIDGSEGSFIIKDNVGNISLKIDEDGTYLKNLNIIGNLNLNSINLNTSENVFLDTGESLVFSIIDDTPERNVAFAVTAEGKVLAKEVASLKPPATIKADLIYFPFYGQSLTLGVGSLPLISTTPKYNSLMFNAGLRPFYPLPSGDEDLSLDPALLTSLIPLQDYALTSYGESPINGALETFRYRLSVDHGVDPDDDFYRLIGCSPASPCSLILLKKIGIDSVSINFRYQALIDTIQAAADLAAADGKTLSVPFLSYTQGETDYVDNTSAATWTGWLTGLRDDVSAEIETITGESDFTIGVYQTPSHNAYSRQPTIALAQLDLALNDPNFVMTTPLYHFDFSDNVHLVGRSSKWMGCYIGLAAERVTQRKAGDPKWLPLHAISAVTQGNISIVQFHVPAPPLVADTTQVADPGNWGFNRIVTPTDDEIAITSVELFGATAVKIIAAEPIPSGSVLQYAHDATDTGSPYFALRAGRLYGPRGNIRDSQGNTIIGDPGGLDLPLHNWLPISEINL